jgi:hypothetical protein
VASDGWNEKLEKFSINYRWPKLNDTSNTRMRDLEYEIRIGKMSNCRNCTQAIRPTMMNQIMGLGLIRPKKLETWMDGGEIGKEGLMIKNYNVNSFIHFWIN